MDEKVAIMKICKACGKEIRVNEKLSEVHEGMHWLCFHLLFEHDGYDPDEACDDLSCPWNIISGRSVHMIKAYADIKLISSDKMSGVFLSKVDFENDRLPSVEFELSVVDEIIQNYTDRIWIEKSNLVDFLNQLKSAQTSPETCAHLESMSPGELILNIQNIGIGGHFKVSFSVKDTKYVRNELNEIKYSNSFEFDYNAIESLSLEIEKLLSATFK